MTGMENLASVSMVVHEHRQVDGPGVRCQFDSNGCSRAVAGRGGFQEHHGWPLSMAGPDRQVKLILCGNHHVRQHALIRFLVENAAGGADSWPVERHFTSAERVAARRAFDLWVAVGSPRVLGWPCPAAVA